MRLVSLAALLVALTAQLAAETHEIIFTDGDGRAYSATITVDDTSHHATSIVGTNFNGESWECTLTPFAAKSLDQLFGHVVHGFSVDGFQFHVLMGIDGVPSGVCRFGGTGPQIVYKISASVKDAVTGDPAKATYR